MKTRESYYRVLGVAKDCSRSEIAAAYRKAIISHHQNARRKPEHEILTLAYSTLVDEERRARYDALGHEAYCRDQDAQLVRSVHEAPGPTEGERGLMKQVVEVLRKMGLLKP